MRFITAQIDMTPILRPAPNLFEEWMIGVVVFIVVVLAYTRMVYAKRLSRLFNSMVRIQILRQVMREELVFSHRASVLLLINFVLIMALIVYLGGVYFEWSFIGEGGLSKFMLIAAIIAGLYIGKLILSRIMRWLLGDNGIIREYLFELFLINKAAGVVLLPLAICLVFVNIGKLTWVIGLVAFIVAGFFLFRIIQGLRLSTSYRVSWVYIILYLCTLEILPFLFLFGALETGKF